MPNELKNIKVQIISLVDKGANGATIIYKSANADMEKLLKQSARIILISKTDDEKHMAYCIVYPVNKVDSQGDWATPEEVEKAMITFMKASNTASVDTQHNLVLADGVTIVENWIVKSGDALFPDDVGAWAAGMYIENEELWGKIKKGEITGFSIYGLGERVPGEVPVQKSITGLYAAGKKKANSLVDAGKVTKSESWNAPSAESENQFIKDNGIEAFASWHLGIDSNADKATKGAYGYIYTSDFKTVDRKGLIAIKQYAAKNSQTEIENAADALIKKIDGEDATAKSFLGEFKKVFKKYFNEEFEMENKSELIIKDFNTELAEQNLCDYVYALCDSLFDILDDETITDKNSAMAQSATQFLSAVQNVVAMKSEIAKAGKVLSDANYKKIQDAISFLQTVVSAADASATTEKAEKVSKKFKKEDSEMTNEEIKKQIDDAVAIVKTELDGKLTEANSKIEKLETEKTELKAQVEKLETASKGSTQKQDIDPPEVKKAFSLPLGLSKPKID